MYMHHIVELNFNTVLLSMLISMLQFVNIQDFANS